MSQNHLVTTVCHFQKISWSNKIFSYLEKVKYTSWVSELVLYLKASFPSWVHIAFLGFIYCDMDLNHTLASCSLLQPPSATCHFRSLGSNSPVRILLIKLYYRRTSVLWVEKWRGKRVYDSSEAVWYLYLAAMLCFVHYHTLNGVVETGSLLSLQYHVLSYCFGTFSQEFGTSRNAVWMTDVNVQIVCCSIYIEGPLQESEIGPTLYEQIVQHAQYSFHVSAALDMQSGWWLKSSKMTI